MSCWHILSKGELVLVANTVNDAPKKRRLRETKQGFCRHRQNPCSIWRRDWDSNPGDALTSTRSPGVRLRPLGHLSVVNNDRYLSKSKMAERARFELARGVNPYPLSRRALSTTQPSLRDQQGGPRYFKFYTVFPKRSRVFPQS